MLRKKMNFYLLFFLCSSCTVSSMERPGIITRQYRNAKTLSFCERKWDSLMHKLVTRKKRKRRSKKPELLSQKKVAYLLEGISYEHESVEHNYFENPLEILEDFSTDIKEEIKDLSARIKREPEDFNGEIEEENEKSKIIEEKQVITQKDQSQKKNGYKMYVAKFTMKKGKLVLRKDFPKL